MTLLRDVVSELFGMFVTDARLSVAILVLVAAVAGLIAKFDLDPLVGGAILFLGCHLILIEAAVREARRRRS